MRADLRAYEIFMAVCDAGSMTGAAKRLRISQAAVSQQIRKLEKALDQRLLDRNKHGIVLTPPGLALRHSVRRIFDELNSVEQSLKNFSGFTVGRLSIGIMDALADTLSPTIMSVLNPQVEHIEIRSGGTVDHRDGLLSHRIDMIISADMPASEEIELFRLANDPLILVTPKGFLQDAPLDLESLAAALPMARLISRRMVSRLIDRFLARNAVLIARAYEFDHHRSMLDAVRRGEAWTICSSFALLHTGLTMSALDVHALPDSAPVRTIALAARKGYFGDLPDKLAAACRTTLAAALDEQLKPMAPRVLSALHVLP